MGLPDRWLDYCPVGKRIPGTRFIPFKVPLKLALNCQAPSSQSFGLWDLLDLVIQQNQELGLIIDLTNTKKYYTEMDVPQSLSYIKLAIEGHCIPSREAILNFKQAVRQFLKENQSNDRLIGVHCTHGLNRTGYLICRYLIDVDGFDHAAAVELFNTSRGHCITRENYIHDLQYGPKRSNKDMNKPGKSPVKGLAVERGLPMAMIKGMKAKTIIPEQEVRTSGVGSAENLPQGKQSKHRRQRPAKKRGKKSCDKAAQDGVPTARTK